MLVPSSTLRTPQRPLSLPGTLGPLPSLAPLNLSTPCSPWHPSHPQHARVQAAELMQPWAIQPSDPQSLRPSSFTPPKRWTGRLRVQGLRSYMSKGLCF